MKSFLRLPAVVAAVSLGLVAAGCADEEARLVEPELDFPYTSADGTSPAPVTFDFGFGNDGEDGEDDAEEGEDEDDNEDSDADDSDDSDDSGDADDSGDRDEPAPAPRRNVRPAPAPAPSLPGAACAWPAQAEAKEGEEFSTFCDREWARTVTSDGQQYFWEARGSGWVSIDPVSEHNGGVCWSKNDFEKAPEAIRNAVVFCDS